MYVCSKQVYFATVMLLLVVICLLSAASASVMAFGRSLMDYNCFLFAVTHEQSAFYKHLPCNVVLYGYATIAVWSLLSIIGHGICSFWHTVKGCLKLGFAIATIVTMVSWVCSITLTAGFATWCEWIKDNSTLSGCYEAAYIYDQRRNTTEMTTFFYIGCSTQSSGWIVTILCCAISVLYLQVCCCKPRKTEDTEELLRTTTEVS